ncbi:MAG TPA: NAD(P)-dependent alcohol dehydrogenase [Solirubrobacteraceae bacterium]|nr:NAD(P)-dependent alcohol dehydrogenase [Solirubrobacteraceae bacterium]
MRAIVQDVYGPPEVLSLREIDRPVPGHGEVLIRVHAAGLDQGVWHVMAGMPYMVRLMGFGLRAPKTGVRGTEVAGVVEAVGRDVARFAPGDEVFGVGEGTFAEYACASEAKLAPKPSNAGFAQAAAVPVSGSTALQALRDTCRLRAGQHVLVIGAGGGVGSFAVQLAKAYGAEVTGVCSSSKADFVRSLGAGAVIDYTREDFADGQRRYDLIVDTAGSRSLAHLRRALADHGTLAIVGGEWGNRWTGGFGRQIARAPLLSLFVGQRLRPVMTKENSADLEELRRAIEAGDVTPAVDRTYPLSEVPAAIRHLRSGTVRGKLVITNEVGGAAG